MVVPPGAVWGTIGCPWLALRADLRFLHQAMQLSYRRSGLCRAVGDEIWIQRMAGEDVEVCCNLMKCYGLGLMAGSDEDLEPLGLDLQGVEGT